LPLPAGQSRQLIPGCVRLLLTLELRRELAEKLSAIKSERNIGAIILALIEAAAKKWQ